MTKPADSIISRDAKKNKLGHGSKSATNGTKGSKDDQKSISYKRKASKAKEMKPSKDVFFDMQVKDPTAHYKAHNVPGSP